jgi:L-asparaginase II
MNTSDIIHAVDGCSAPTFALPLHHLAQGFARLGVGTHLANDSTHDYQYGLDMACQAMVAHPEMVSGEGRNDLAFSLASKGDWVCKIGAEGVQSIAIKSLGLGIAIKVADGNMRALYPATIAVLNQMGLLNEVQRQALSSWANPILNNAAGLAVGDIISVVQLREFT